MRKSNPDKVFVLAYKDDREENIAPWAPKDPGALPLVETLVTNTRRLEVLLKRRLKIIEELMIIDRDIFAKETAISEGRNTLSKLGEDVPQDVADRFHT